MTCRLLNTPQYQHRSQNIPSGGGGQCKVKKGFGVDFTAVSDQKQFNKIIIVSICCHDAENMLNDKGGNGRLFEEGSVFMLG